MNAKMSGGYLTLYMQYNKNPKHVYKFLGVKYHNEKSGMKERLFKPTKQSVSLGPEQPPAHSRWQHSLTERP